ncbi:unnamed protein product [Microthlaspi erraticum]|uniref:Arabidopsis retrotransposon Orf1 C-terminal domain-containing protein n=1 Tax=Microthlaspi erraticum TaxID=1685480 RepID=A0A6D2J2R0_9BRAS|nr:unnamed protein product [Microthlaspi erraticum]
MESYKELTCEFLASMSITSLMSSIELSWTKAGDQEPVLEICPQGTCQHLLCKESHWTINEGEVKLLDMGIKPIISRTRDGKKIRGDRHTQGISCLSLSSSKPTRSQLTTLGTKRKKA